MLLWWRVGFCWVVALPLVNGHDHDVKWHIQSYIYFQVIFVTEQSQEQYMSMQLRQISWG